MHSILCKIYRNAMKKFKLVRNNTNIKQNKNLAISPCRAAAGVVVV